MERALVRRLPPLPPDAARDHEAAVDETTGRVPASATLGPAYDAALLERVRANQA